MNNMNISLFTKKNTKNIETPTIQEQADRVWKFLILTFFLVLGGMSVLLILYFIGIDNETFITQNDSVISPKQIDQSKLNQVLQYFTDKETITNTIPTVDQKQ